MTFPNLFSPNFKHKKMLIKLQVSNLEELNIYITIKKIVKLNEFAFLRPTSALGPRPFRVTCPLLWETLT